MRQQANSNNSALTILGSNTCSHKQAKRQYYFVAYAAIPALEILCARIQSSDLPVALPRWWGRTTKDAVWRSVGAVLCLVGAFLASGAYMFVGADRHVRALPPVPRVADRAVGSAGCAPWQGLPERGLTSSVSGWLRRTQHRSQSALMGKVVRVCTQPAVSAGSRSRCQEGRRVDGAVQRGPR